MCERGAKQFWHLLRFVEKDKELIEIEDDMAYLVKLKLAHRYFRQLCEKKTTLKDLRHLDDALYGLILDTVEEPNQTLMDIRNMEEQELKAERKEVSKELDDILHELLHVTLPEVVCKCFFNRLDDLTPVETLFVYENMGEVYDRLGRHAKCIQAEWKLISSYIKNTFDGRCRRCGTKKAAMRRSPACGIVQFCSYRCHREDLEDKVAGHKMMEAKYHKL